MKEESSIVKEMEKVPLSQWLTCFCVVKFDIEIGQTLEYTYPPMKFTDEETTNVCFMSFPDSNSVTGDTLYSFRTRIANGGKNEYLHGYVFFRQVKDASITRGYLQKSVVLMSPHPYVGLFKKVMSVVGPIFFDCGTTLLEAAYHNIALWPDPTPGKTFELPILGSTLTYHVPYSSSTPHIIDPSTRVLAFTPRDQVVSNLQSVNIYNVFKAIPSKLWLLWELVLTGEPLLIVSPSPPQCSDAVIGLVSLISPLRYCGDYRPYFTIHDSDFKNYTQPFPEDGKEPALILGVTNPFFFKALTHWPHVITVGAQSTPAHPRHTTPPKIPVMQRDRVSKHVTDYKEGVQSSHKALVEPDNKILKQLISPSSSSSLSLTPSSSSPPPSSPLSAAVNNELLRRHFLRLTESFLVPLERYFTSLMPLALKKISLFHKPPRLKAFNKAEFLDIVASLDKPFIINNKSKEVELYKRFLLSVNFQGWFSERKQAALKQLNLLYRKIIFDADIPTLLKGRNNVETVDLYMRLREQLIAEEAKREKLEALLNTNNNNNNNNNNANKGENEREEMQSMCNKLRQHLGIVCSFLPNISPSSLSPPSGTLPPSPPPIPVVSKQRRGGGISRFLHNMKVQAFNYFVLFLLFVSFTCVVHGTCPVIKDQERCFSIKEGGYCDSTVSQCDIGLYCDMPYQFYGGYVSSNGTCLKLKSMGDVGTFKGCLPDVASRQCGDGYSCLKTSNDSNFICSITFDGKSGSYCDPQATQSSVYCASEYCAAETSKCKYEEPSSYKPCIIKVIAPLTNIVRKRKTKKTKLKQNK